MRRIILFILFVSLSCCGVDVMAQSKVPCKGTTIAVLNMRKGPGTNFGLVMKLSRGSEVIVKNKCGNGWVQVKYNLLDGYVYGKYLVYTDLPQVSDTSSPQSSNNIYHQDWSLWTVLYLLLKIFLVLFCIAFVWSILAKVGPVVLVVTYYVFKVLSFPMFFLNALQRILMKPWLLFLKKNKPSRDDEFMRLVLEMISWPLWIVALPLRLLNAFCFNIILHNCFELFNYILEVIFPSMESEGEDSVFRWIVLLPWRIVKYPLWHGTLTFIESVIWTVLDIVMPAMTLFHGTSPEAAISIVSSPCRGEGRYSSCAGLWMVGGGNYAGNGIYFAPRRRTARHYSNGALIIARVTLGKTLDLAAAPYHVYSHCGYCNATAVNTWAMSHGYVTGEWWRSDESWWEYCMYDWQNRYNVSWRIRPLYVMDLNDKFIMRIPGGMHHWLFRKLALQDIFESMFS